MQNPVIIFGAKQLGITALDIFNSNEVVVYCFLDDDEKLHQMEMNNITVMGDTEATEFLKLLGKTCDACVATEDAATRRSITEMLREDYKTIPVNAIHKFSYVSEQAWLGHGNLIAAGVVVGANAKVGDNCIIRPNAVIDAGAVVGNEVEIGAGAAINSDVTIEDGAFIGSGVTIVSGVKVGKNARIGAGSVVIADVAAKQTVFGNPAQAVK
ncbi:MAG: NeuD/PglB/VioB family sugar acetyltransferase [Hymenobacteraceae bacterium]|nr:NeuD/PglB/VioB family sugar acetyltransferase [Hymenobacteraceae bacterium]MDX5397383.1 NeuD/PglB/VioB family sugar acetyltransferase [Hymenobacteraceae bacterium]MDX5513461.1 NeuD/PglB/VioB family sugar acetyltransferase [Hymenobacteraceae bacterium]